MGARGPRSASGSIEGRALWNVPALRPGLGRLAASRGRRWRQRAPVGSAWIDLWRIRQEGHAFGAAQRARWRRRHIGSSARGPVGGASLTPPAGVPGGCVGALSVVKAGKGGVPLGLPVAAPERAMPRGARWLAQWAHRPWRIGRRRAAQSTGGREGKIHTPGRRAGPGGGAPGPAAGPAAAVCGVR